MIAFFKSLNYLNKLNFLLFNIPEKELLLFIIIYYFSSLLIKKTAKDPIFTKIINALILNTEFSLKQYQFLFA